MGLAQFFDPDNAENGPNFVKITAPKMGLAQFRDDDRFVTEA